MFRVYYDRLIDDGDRAWLFGHVQKMVKESLKEDFNNLFASYCTNKETGVVSEDNLRCADASSTQIQWV